MRRRPLRPGKGPERRGGLRRSGSLQGRASLARRPLSPASPAQRAKVRGQPCLVCAGRPVDPAHLVPRSLGGCDEPECVVPLCRLCHRAYDRGELDLLPHLEPGRREEVAHALSHLTLIAAVQRLSGQRWGPK
jgi:hypothetical protein